MTTERQDEFLFLGGAAPELRMGHPLEELFEQISTTWGVPLRRPVRLRLRDQSIPELTGILELVRAPDLPLDKREPLRLRLKGIEFTHRDISEWTAL
ncbi:MAG TPA: hypothetical protein VGD81_02850 [Opitutaceae bacterium]